MAKKKERKPELWLTRDTTDNYGHLDNYDLFDKKPKKDRRGDFVCFGNASEIIESPCIEEFHRLVDLPRLKPGEAVKISEIKFITSKEKYAK